MTEQALELREVRGPSALGGGRRRFLELLQMIAVTEFRRTYFGTVLGYLWSLCRPLLLFGVLLVVFTNIVRFGNVVHYPVLLLFNIVVFGFFTEATTTAVTSIVAQEGIVRKTQFPRLVIPLAIVLTSLFNLIANLLVVFVFILGFGIEPSWSWFGLIPILALLCGLTVGVSVIVATLYPRFRDMAIIWTVAATALFYATPVLYPIDRISNETLRTLIEMNPITPLLELARRWIIDPAAPVPHGTLQIVVPLAIYVSVCAFAAWVFRREAPRIAEEL